MTIWVRIGVTIALMILGSFLAGWLYNSLLGAHIPSYISGIIDLEVTIGTGVRSGSLEGVTNYAIGITGDYARYGRT